MNEELLQRLYFLGQQDGLDPQKTSYDDFKNLVISKVKKILLTLHLKVFHFL